MFGICSLKHVSQGDYKIYFEPILYIPVPQTGHLALRAGLPFFMVTCSGLSTSLLARHFTQYIDAINQITSLQKRIKNYELGIKVYITFSIKRHSGKQRL